MCSNGVRLRRFAFLQPDFELSFPPDLGVVQVVKVGGDGSNTFDEDFVVGVVLALAAACHQAGEVASARVVARCDKSKGIRTR